MAASRKRPSRTIATTSASTIREHQITKSAPLVERPAVWSLFGQERSVVQPRLQLGDGAFCGPSHRHFSVLGQLTQMTKAKIAPFAPK